MIIVRTPYRVSLFGGGTDFPQWFKQHGGAVLTTAIDKYCYLTVRELPPFFSHRHRIVYGKSETVTDWSEIEHPVVREVLRVYDPGVGLEIHHDGDLPARSGIGSSAAFSVGILKAMDTLTGRNPSPESLASRAIRLETGALSEFGGWQDQIACSLGGLKFIKFSTDGSWTASSVPVPEERYKELFSSLVLVYLGTSRHSSKVSEGLRPAIGEASRELDTNFKLAQAVLDELTLGTDALYEVVGNSFNQAWEIKQRINASAITPSMNEARDLLSSYGATGIKVSGAGGGGFLVCAVDPLRMPQFREKASAVGLVVPFQPDSQGSQIIYHDGATIPTSLNVQESWFSERPSSGVPPP